MRIVLDANVYVSSLLTRHGNAKTIIDLFDETDFELLVSEPILEEIARVLGYPHIAKLHQRSAQDIDDYIKSLRVIATFVAPRERLQIASDESDNRYIECAVEGRADFLVTGDKKHLLPLKEYQDVQILSPAAFLALLQLDNT